MKNETKIIIGIVIAAVAILIVGAFVFSKNAVQDEVVSNEPVAMDILVKPNSHTTGLSQGESKVTLVEFADFECPACAYAHPMTKKIMKDYADKITLVYRNFPLHINSNLAIYAAEAAGEQGKFWEMHDRLFEGQQSWTGKPTKEVKEIFGQYATEIGLDVTKFKDVMDSKKYDNLIESDKKDGNTAGVGGTPTFFLNGKRLEGGVPTEAGLRKLIDEALKAKVPATPTAEIGNIEVEAVPAQ
ncbi:MAG TPA: thioredoxin domain-containing protein [Candidatus Paceibacterota bacterium]